MSFGSLKMEVAELFLFFFYTFKKMTSRGERFRLTQLYSFQKSDNYVCVH